ncbi:hypothetical protein WCQ02_33620 [Paraburkholderia tropica]|uniref:hypothetical protein n=1 Tax=Paraburkholderia tropica TaxID=92647 RepID=UPI0030174980
MNGKFVMEVTVTELMSPLLFARLSACSSPRERAAVFKSCAEAHLRGDPGGGSESVARRTESHASDDRRSVAVASIVEAPASRKEPPRANSAPRELGLQTIPTADDSSTSGVVDETIGADLATFL